MDWVQVPGPGAVAIWRGIGRMVAEDKWQLVVRTNASQLWPCQCPDVADVVVAKCPKMRHKHAHEFCNLPQQQD